MKKNTLIWVVVIAAIALIAVWMVGRYNVMVTEEENVETAWGQVENQYQRRTDLVNQLVGAAEGMAIYESQYMTDVISARAKATQITVDPSNITPEQLQQFQAAQGELSQALGRLLVSVEQYPELKGDQHFMKLMTEIEGSENRLAVARNTFNEQARVYNTYIRKFPNNIIAGMFGFDKRPYFEAEEGAKKAPTVDFKSLKH